MAMLCVSSITEARPRLEGVRSVSECCSSPAVHTIQLGSADGTAKLKPQPRMQGGAHRDADDPQQGAGAQQGAGGCAATPSGCTHTGAGRRLCSLPAGPCPDRQVRDTEQPAAFQAAVAFTTGLWLDHWACAVPAGPGDD